MGFNIIWASMRETLLTLLVANNKDADQPAHPYRLICAFVFHYLKSKVTIILHFLVGFSKIKPLATPLVIVHYVLPTWRVFEDQRVEDEK